MNKILVLLSLLISQAILVSSIEFTFEIRKKKSICFGEFLAPRVLVVGSVKPNASYETFKGEIKNQKGEVIIELVNNLDYTFSLTSFDEGNYEFCFSNNGNMLIKVDVNFKIGAEAKDYSGILTNQTITEVDVTMKSIKESLKLIGLDTHTMSLKHDEISAKIDSVSSKLIFFSVLTILTLGAMTYLYITYMKSFFRNKKLI